MHRTKHTASNGLAIRAVFELLFSRYNYYKSLKLTLSSLFFFFKMQNLWENKHYFLFFFFKLWPHPSITRHWARPKQSASCQSPVEEKRVTGCPSISKTEIVSYHNSMDDPWCPSDSSWTKDSVGDVFEVLSISEPICDVSQSRQTFQITDKYVKSWFPLNMNCFTDCCTDYLSMKVIVLKYTPEVLGNIKPL